MAAASMHLDDIGGGAMAQTGGGAIDVGTVNGELACILEAVRWKSIDANGKLMRNTGGGNVEIWRLPRMPVSKTGGGSIDVQQCDGRVKVSTGGGSIDLGDIGGPRRDRNRRWQHSSLFGKGRGRSQHRRRGGSNSMASPRRTGRNWRWRHRGEIRQHRSRAQRFDA